MEHDELIPELLRIISYSFVLFRSCCTISGTARHRFALNGAAIDLRTFLKSATAAGLALGVVKPHAHASIPEHNWDKYDWGSGPPVLDRLYQGPFPQYGPCAVVPESDVSMITSPSREIVSNYDMGLIVYLSDDTGPLKIPGQTQEKTLEDGWRTGS